VALWGRHLRPRQKALVSGLRITCSPVPFIRSGILHRRRNQLQRNEVESGQPEHPYSRESAGPEGRMQVLQLSLRIKLNLGRSSKRGTVACTDRSIRLVVERRIT